MTIDRRTILQAGASALAVGLAPQGAFAQAEAYRIGALNPVTGAGAPMVPAWPQ